jgi:hypothetical protein
MRFRAVVRSYSGERRYAASLCDADFTGLIAVWIDPKAKIRFFRVSSGTGVASQLTNAA